MRTATALLVVFAVLALLCSAADAQQQNGFQTRITPEKITGGTKVTVEVIFPDVTRMPPLAINHAMFVFGTRYHPPTAPYVMPLVPFAFAEFKRERLGSNTAYIARFSFVVPKTLPKNFMLNFYMQGVTLEKIAKAPGHAILWAMPAKAQLVG